MSNKRWAITLLVLCTATLILLAFLIMLIDPYFHYHAPLEQLSYPLNKQRYQNDGIVRHFSYDAVITGTSVTENFKSSECDALFGVTSVKIPMEAATYKEVNETLRRALDANPEIRMVIRSLDGTLLVTDKDQMAYKEYPTYLTDDNLFNDVRYLLSKHVLFEDALNVVKLTAFGIPSTTFDEYSNWMHKFSFGKDAVLRHYTRPESIAEPVAFTGTDAEILAGNLAQNVISLARQYPDVEFYCFFPPYSIVHWDLLAREGTMDYQIQACRLATEQLLEQDNIHVYSFSDQTDMVQNLDNYSDPIHFHEDINSRILQWIRDGHGLLTKENYQTHWDLIQAHFSVFDYDSLF